MLSLDAATSSAKTVRLLGVNFPQSSALFLPACYYGSCCVGAGTSEGSGWESEGREELLPLGILFF